MNPTSEPTPEEVIRQLREIDPNRSYCVGMECWHHGLSHGQEAPRWDIWIGGNISKHFYGSSLTGALENAKAGLLGEDWEVILTNNTKTMNIGHHKHLKPNMAKRDKKPEYLREADRGICAALGETTGALFTGGHLLLKKQPVHASEIIRAIGS